MQNENPNTMISIKERLQYSSFCHSTRDKGKKAGQAIHTVKQLSQWMTSEQHDCVFTF